MRAPGVALQVAPSAGVLAAHARAPLHVSVYADCWGLYHDQLLILVRLITRHLARLLYASW